MENPCMSLLFIVHLLASSCFLVGISASSLMKAITVAMLKGCGRINRREQDVPWIMALGPSSPGDMLHNSNTHGEH